MAKPITVASAGGEYMENVVVLDWTVALGAPVKVGDLLVTVETAKAATEIAPEVDGFLTAIFAWPGSEVPLSAELGLIGATAEDVEHVVADAAAVAPKTAQGAATVSAPLPPPPRPHPRQPRGAGRGPGVLT